jgi:hypothetical protein
MRTRSPTAFQFVAAASFRVHPLSARGHKKGALPEKNPRFVRLSSNTTLLIWNFIMKLVKVKHFPKSRVARIAQSQCLQGNFRQRFFSRD